MENNLDLRSEEIQDVLTKIPNWVIRWGNLLIFFLFISVLFISYFIKYPDVISAEIIITTQIPPEKLIAKTNGNIEKIFISDNENVSKDQPLAVIKSNSDYNDVFILNKIINNTKITDNQIVFSNENFNNYKLGEIESFYANFEKDYLAFIMYKNFEPNKVEIKGQSKEINLLKNRLYISKQELKLTQDELNFKKNELERFKILYSKGIIAAQEWENKQAEYLQFEKNFKRANITISELNSTLANQLKNKEITTINDNKDDLILYMTAIKSFNQLKKAISDWELTYLLKSSIEGKVSFLQIWSENQFVASGENVFTVVPKNEANFIGKAKASVKNSGKLKIGQHVIIRLNNYPDREFGILKGVVSSISLTPNKEGFLLLNINIPNKLITSYKRELPFKQEMTGVAEIITEDSRLIERILFQIKDMFKF